MTKFNAIAGVAVAAFFAVSTLYTVHEIVGHTRVESSRVLLAGRADGEQWQRVLLGARAAAKDYGIELRTETPPADATADQQSAWLQSLSTSGCDGAVVVMEDSTSSVDLIDDLAKHTKLVTVGKDTENSRRLCHVGFNQMGAGSKVAWMAHRELSREGNVVLLTTEAPDSQGEIVRQRLAGFQDGWETSCNAVSHHPLVTVAVGDGSGLLQALANPKSALIVAFDVAAAEAAIKTMVSQPASECIPIIALDSSDSILDAIESGHVSLALFNDAYEDGYEAIGRVAKYSHDDELSLPAPGWGSSLRCGEIVRKSNVADIRSRLATPLNAGSEPPQLHLSSAEVNASLVGP
ncbi:MAG TPA: substrate-binding domain-containing protein [Lacipirellulaceae bacterium]|jgi:ribose transport system substrate-binding protein|nr:substrate-binding domain-containing protein [Lacipirellulaceae bacterium]